MNKVNVVGLGPGSAKYILPIVSDIINEGDLLIGSRRSLELFNDQPQFIYENNLSEMIKLIQTEKERKKIVVIVTGDTGFYSLLDYLKKHIGDNELIVTPGISSFQYFFSRLKKSYKDYALLSLHGRSLDLIEELTRHKKLFLLTDSLNSPKVIATILTEAGYGKGYMVVGENLSYKNESILEGSISSFVNHEFKNLCVVVVEYEMA